MKKIRRSAMDPSYFQEVGVGNVKYTSNEEESYYEKGKKSDPDIRFEGDTLIVVGKKGENDMHIDLGGARKIVQTLRNDYAATHIKELRGDIKKKFVELHDMIEVLFGTSAYKHVHEMILSEFHCNNDHRFAIGTVGAYFCECQSSSNFPGNKTCSLGCLLGLHPEGCEGTYPCEYTCIVYNGDETFSVLRRVTDVHQAYLFVNDKLHFSGLTAPEVKKLQNMGVEEVKVVKHSDGLSYQEVSSNFVRVDRLRVIRSASPQKRSSAASAVLVIVVIVIIIALIFGGWYYYKNGGRFEFLRY